MVMPLSDPVPIIDVPVVDELPETEARRPDVIRTVDYLLTRLLRHDSGTLYADFHHDAGRWHVRGWTREASGPDEVVATIEPLGVFRMLLARFGAHYMGNQLYGGYSELRLSQRGRTQGFAIYMANDSWRGFWVKAYCATAVFKPAEDGNAGAA